MRTCGHFYILNFSSRFLFLAIIATRKHQNKLSKNIHTVDGQRISPFKVITLPKRKRELIIARVPI